MQLIILTPSDKEVIEVSWVECNTPTGNYIIQEGHAPTIMLLSEKKDFVYCRPNGKHEIIIVHGGILQVTRTDLTLLLQKK